MDRGDVYLVDLALPNRDDPTGAPITLKKYVVVLRGGDAVEGETDVPVIIASTNRRGGDRALRRFEVGVGESHGFHHATVLDCRWPATLTKSHLSGGRYCFRLSAETMQDVDRKSVV